MSNQRAGYAAILLGAFLFGMWATAGKFVLRDVPPLTVAWFVQAVSAVTFAPFLWRLRLSSREWRLTLISATFGGLLAPSLYFTGLNLTTPVNATLISNTEGLFTVVLAFVVLRERLRRGGYVASAAILGGALLVTLNLEQVDADFGSAILGNILLVLAAMCWGVDNTVSRIVTMRHDIPSFVCVKLSFGALFLSALLLGSGGSPIIASQHLPLLLVLALTGAAAFTYLFYFAMRRIGALRVGAILATSAAFGVAIAVAFGFPLTPIQALGGAIMAIGVVVMYREPVPRSEGLSADR